MDQRIFKADIQLPVEAIINEIVPRLIEIAVIKAQFEVVEALYLRTSYEANNFRSGLQFTHSELLQILGKLSHDYRKQLDHVATTEMLERLDD